MINEAADKGANLIVLPELCNTGYVFNTRAEAYSLAEPVPDGPTTEAWMKVAKERDLYIVAGITESEGIDLYNSAVVVGPDGWIGTHRKVTLWNEEAIFFEPGNKGNQVFHTKIGRISAMICYDMWFPEQWRNCALGGADIVCCPTNWVTFDGLPNDVKNFGVYLAEAAAHSNNIFVAAADRIGTERGCPFPGRSLIIDRNGCPLVGPIGDEEDIIYAEINLSDARRLNYNEFNKVLDDRRIDLWGTYLGPDEEKRTLFGR
jgi:predicted amidohydrolase